MTRTITFNPDAIEEIDALYIIHMANKVLGSDAVTSALSAYAWFLASANGATWRDSETAVFDNADAIYPQPCGSTTWHQADAKAAEHLRRFGFLTGE